MAKDYGANPQENKNFTQTAEIKYAQDIQDYSEFLPTVNRSESLTRFFGSTVNQLLSSGSTQSIDAYWGRLAGRNYNPDNERFMPESEDLRLNYQFQPGTVSRTDGEISQTVSYINWLKRLESLGSDLTNHDRLFSEPGYVLDVPINADMLVNYRNYYWLEGLPPVIVINPNNVNNAIDLDDIVKSSQYTTPTLNNFKTVEFVSGLRVRFTGDNISSSSGDYFADYVYYVENVGGEGGIKLIAEQDNLGNDLFPSVVPYEVVIREGWDTVDWDTTDWDGIGIFDEYAVPTTEQRLDLDLNKSYIVMERWAADKNPWARSNKWFSIHAINTIAEFNDLEAESLANIKTRAQRPIIEFRANMELFNFCKIYVEQVDYVISIDQVSEILAGQQQYFADSENALQNGDIVLVARDDQGGVEIVEFNTDFNTDFDSGEESVSGPFSSAFSNAFSVGVQSAFNQQAFVVGGVGTNITLTPHNTYSEDEYVVVAKGTEKGAVYGFKDGDWIISQNKISRATPPLFNLYDQNQAQLVDFTDTDFIGDPVFSYMINESGPFDRELGLSPVYTQQGSFSDFQFEWTLSNSRYKQNIILDTSTEINGYYFWHDWVRDEHYNGWSTVRGGQRVPLIQTQVSNGVTPIVFNLGTDKIKQPTEFTVIFENDSFKWWDHSYIDRNALGEPNPVLIWKFDTVYTLNTLIGDAANKIVFLDPDGNAANITINEISAALTEVTVVGAYDYDKIIYQSDTDPTVFGEIFVSNSNHNRYRVTRNGQQLIDTVDFNFVGNEIQLTNQGELNDVFELVYFADADLTGVVYDVAPVHFYNSENNPFTQVGYDDLINHFTRQMVSMPGFSGQAIGKNNYHRTVRIHNYDGLIRQQIFETKPIQYLLNQEAFNPIRALKNISNDYADFKQHFKNKVFQLWNSREWNSVRELVDRAINDINIGKTHEFKYAHSDMLYSKQFKSKSYNINNDQTVFLLPDIINKYGDTQNHVQAWLADFDVGLGRLIERPLTVGVDYYIDGPRIVLTASINLPVANVLNAADNVIVNADNVVAAVPGSGNARLILRWFDYRQTSHVPFSAVKLGFFRPTQIEIVNGELVGHDGSRHTVVGTEFFNMLSADFDVVTAALLDFELRIFNNLVSEHFLSDSLYNYSMMEFYPNPTSEYAYSITDINSRLDDWYNRWAIRNNVNEINTVNYDGADEFTWNYSTVGPNLGSWRSLYVHNFGTDRPHTHPWEILGHTIKPDWWDATYSWTAGALRTALVGALTYGIVGDNTSPNKIDIRYARNSYAWSTDILVSSDGSATLQGPVTAGLVAAPASVDAAKPFVFGDWSEVENTWRKSSEYLFALAETLLQLKPYRTHDLFWTLRRWNINQSVTQEQWIDPQFCMRKHSTELHNQIITSGIIYKIRVLNAGTGYTTLDLSFKQDSGCYQNASARAYTVNGQVIGVAITEPGRGFDNEPDVEFTATLGASGVSLEYLIDFNFHLTRLGFNTLPAEEYVKISSNSEQLANTLSALQINYVLHVGGFTDKRILALELDGNYSNGLVRIPENSYEILLERNAPSRISFYSGVSIEKIAGVGFRIDGYNLDSKFFNFFRPSQSGRQVAVDIGNTRVTKFLNWHNETYRVPYRTTITKRQDLYSFILGLGKYYEAQGFDNFTNWEQDARAAIEWALSTNTEVFYINGISESLFYRQGDHGVVQTVDVNYDGVANILDQEFKPIRRNEMLVLRDTVQTEIAVKTPNKMLMGIGMRVIDFEHTIVLDNMSTFNDIIYIPELGVGQNRIRFVGERTRNWNGRIEAAGYIIKPRGLILNIESSVRELENDWISAESKALERLTRQTIGYNAGYSKPTYMTDMFISDRSAYKFETGLRKYNGTELAISAMTRNRNIFGEEFAHELYEDWLVRLGDFGDKSERNPLQFAVDPNKIKSNPQHFRFNAEFVSDRSDDLIIDMHSGSPDAISGNFGTPFDVYEILPADNTRITALEDFQNFALDAGLPLVDEIDYFLGSITNIGEIYNPIAEYALIPNWSESFSYVQGDQVRRFGKVYRLLLESTGLTNLNNNIVIRGTQVFPLIANGTTFIVNGVIITFEKFSNTVSTNTIVETGSVVSPTVMSGSTLNVDGVSINFIKTVSTTTFSDIEIEGNVTNPSIINSASRQLIIRYANSVVDSLTTVTVNFNELDTTLSMQQIWIDALTTAGAVNSITLTNSRLSALETFRTAYVAANSAAAWQTNVMQPYYDDASAPNRVLNPEIIGALILATPGAPWEAAARSLIQLDLNLIAELGSAHSETVDSIIDNILINSATWEAARLAANTLFDMSLTPNVPNANLQDYVTFVKNNGSLSIVVGRRITVTNPTEYVVDNATSIANKINVALIISGAPNNISANAFGSRVNLIRVNNSSGFRLGVSTDLDIGFTVDDNDVVTEGTTVVGPTTLNLSEIVQAINNTTVVGVSAQSADNRVRILSTNATLNIAASSALASLGLNEGTITANTTIVSTPVDLVVGDVITQINAANVPNLTASQVQGAVLLTYVGEQLVIGPGTANPTIGIAENTYESLSDEVSNVFEPTDWEVIQDPAHFNIWTIDNIGADPEDTQTNENRYNVYQTLDFQIGITEICAGSESGDDALIKCDRNHNLSPGDYVLILNSTCIPSVDGIHRVTTTSSNSLNFFIDRYIEQKGFTGKVLPIRSVKFPTSIQAISSLNTLLYSEFNEDAVGLGLRNGDYVYVVENFSSLGISRNRGAVYQVLRNLEGIGLQIVREETGKTRNNNIKNGILYSNSAGNTVNRYETFDPLKGIIPGIADREIDIKSEVDFAYYNNSTDPAQELRDSNHWGQQQVGSVWWDLGNAIYLNYDQSTPEYRQDHWGELFPTATIDVYEWTKSPVTPDEYESAVQGGTIIDGVELTGMPYGILDQFGELQYNWCEELEINSNTNQVETYFYFWVKNKTTTPTFERNFSILQIAQIIEDPLSQRIDWMAATGANTLLVSSLTESTGFNDLIMKVNFDFETQDYHQEFVLLSENDPRTVIPEWLHISLRDSLAGFTQAKGTYALITWNSTDTYDLDDVVISLSDKIYRCFAANTNVDPDLDTAQNYWNLLELDQINPDGVVVNGANNVSVNESQSVPDTRLHPFARLGIETRPHQSWFGDLTAARRAAVEKINAQLIEFNLIDSDIPWRQEFERTFTVGDLEFDITEYWNFYDWSLDDGSYERDVGDYFVEILSELSGLTPIQGEIAHVENSDDVDGRTDRRQVYRYENGTWVLVFKERATIQFNTLLWDNIRAETGWDVVAWDTTEWDRSSSDVTVEIFDSFYNRLWIGEYKGLYVDIWFHMAKYVLVEQNEVDWIFKSSYFNLFIQDSFDKQYNKYFNDNQDAFFDFVDTIKPFRSKLRNAVVQKTTTDESDLAVVDTLELRVQTNPVDDTIDEDFTRSFRLSVGQNQFNYSGQIVNQNKVLLGLDIDPTATIIPYINDGSTTIPSGPGAIWINGERIEYTSLSDPLSQEFGSGFDSGFDAGFGGITLLLGVVRGTHGTLARAHQIVDTIEFEIDLAQSEQLILSDYGSDITPAWNELGDGLLDINNLDPNGVGIRAQGFGTIDLYGDLLLLKWIYDQQTAEAIAAFQSQLSQFIEDHYSYLYVDITADMDVQGASSVDYTADGSGSPGPL